MLARNVRHKRDLLFTKAIKLKNVCITYVRNIHLFGSPTIFNDDLWMNYMRQDKTVYKQNLPQISYCTVEWHVNCNLKEIKAVLINSNFYSQLVFMVILI